MRSMIASSSAFQAWLGAVDQVAAEARVHVLHTGRKPPLPLCLLDLGDQFERVRARIMNGRPFESTGQIVVYFRDVVPSGVDDVDAVYAFTNQLGAVWQDLEHLAGRPGMVGITAITLAVPPTRIESDRRQYAGDYFEAALSCSFRLT
jgi:hypothetical protein